MADFATIVVAEFEEASSPAGPLDSVTPVVNVRASIGKVMKDAHHTGLLPGKCQVTIRRPFGRVGAGSLPQSYWTKRDIHAGQKYIILSNAEGDLATIIEQAGTAELIEDGIDSIGDVDLILRSDSLPIREQIRNAVAALGRPQHHGWLLARYVAALLAAGSDAETTPLTDLLENGRAAEFSEHGKEVLLGSLDDNARSPVPRRSAMPLEPGRASDNLIRVFASLTVRYFSEPPTQPSQPATHLQRAILENYLPFLRKSEQGAPALHRQIASVNKQVREAALRCLEDNRLTEDEKNEARELVKLVN